MIGDSRHATITLDDGQPLDCIASDFCIDTDTLSVYDWSGAPVADSSPSVTVTCAVTIADPKMAERFIIEDLKRRRAAIDEQLNRMEEH